MTVRREYSCNICRETLRHDLTGGHPIGLKWVSNVLAAAPWREAETHVCVRCLCSLQALPPVCRQGIQGCRGGMTCQSDHK